MIAPIWLIPAFIMEVFFIPLMKLMWKLCQFAAALIGEWI